LGKNPTTLGIFDRISTREKSITAALETPNDKKFSVLFEFVACPIYSTSQELRPHKYGDFTSWRLPLLRQGLCKVKMKVVAVLS